MLYFLKIFSILLSYYIILVHPGFLQDKLFDGIDMHIDRMDSQCRMKKVPCLGFHQGLKTKSTKLFIENCTILVKEGNFKKLMLTVIINRCRSKENLDTCEQYLKQENIDFCKATDPTNPLISNSPFYAPFEPPLKCPLEKGIYQIFNMSFDLAPFILFKLEGWYWKTRVEIFSGEQNNRLIFCSYLEGYITNSKSKKN